MAIFTLVTATRKKAAETIKSARAGKDGKDDKGGKYSRNLVRVPYIRYSITFQRKSVSILALFDLGSKVNAIHPTFVQELKLSIKLIDVGV